MHKKLFSILLAACLLAATLPALAETVESVKPPFGAFEADNILGDTPITNEIFAEAELTLVNFWATWCPPCREELPDLAKLNTMSEGRVKVLGVLTDALDTRGKLDEKAIAEGKEMLEAVEADFPVAVPDAWLNTLGSALTAVPTTFLVDSEGRMLGAVTGARTAEAWMALAEETLDAAK